MLVSCKLSLRGHLGRVLVYASRNLIGYFSGRVRGVGGLLVLPEWLLLFATNFFLFVFTRYCNPAHIL